MKKQKRNDIILISLILITAFILMTVYFFKNDKGKYAAVIIAGKETARYSLNTDIKTDIITEKNGVNTLIIKDGAAYISYADCPDKICVSHRKISKAGESIICLPHKLVISIEN